MKELLKKIKITSVILALCYIVIGLLWIILPSTTNLALTYILGALFFLTGVIAFINYFVYGFESMSLLFAFIMMFAGVLFFIYAKGIEGTSFLPITISLIFVTRTVFGGIDAVDYKKANNNRWWIALTLNIILLLCTILFFAIFWSEAYAGVFVGSIMILQGLVTIFVNIIVCSNLKKISKSVTNIFEDIVD